MRILYLGALHDYSGYGVTGRDYVECLIDELGYDVTPVSTDPSASTNHLSKKWQELLSKDPSGNYDVAIVHKSPWNQDGRPEYLHNIPIIENCKRKIFFTIFETTKWPSNWKPILEPFDEIVTFSEWQADACLRMMGKRPNVIPHVIEGEFQAWRVTQEKPETYIYYSEVSRVTHRKGLDLLLKGYFVAFEESDNVLLRIKMPGDVENNKRFMEILEEAALCFNYKKLPKLEVCQAFLTDEQMDRLYDEAHCFISTARGEGFCVPIHKAALKGMPVIAPLHYGGIPTWTYDLEIFCIMLEAEIQHTITPDFANHNMKIDTSGMKWFEANPYKVSESMRYAYENCKLYKRPGDLKDKLSKSTVSKKLKRLLENE